MAEAKHTPGPWEACDVGDYSDYDGRCRVILGDDLRIVVVLGDHDESAANARLIAAAPDLLEALGELLPQNLGAPPDALQDHMTVPVDMTIGEIRRALAAIAKAKGDT